MNELARIALAWVSLLTMVAVSGCAIEKDPAQQRLEQAAGVDVGASQSTLADAATQWDVARATFEAGHTDDAIAVAREVKLELDTEAAVMRVPAPRVDP